MLGGEPIIMGTVGQDAGPYLDYLKKLGISTAHITEVLDTFTAQAMITTDLDNNQITAFHPGAMSHSSINSVKNALPARLGLVGPDSREGMLHHATQFAESGVPFIFDLGQAMPLFDGADLRHFVELASYVVVNDYEAQVMLSRTGYSAAELAQRVEAYIVTCGEEGAEIYAGGKQYTFRSCRPNVWSTRPVAATRSAAACSMASRTVWTGTPPAASPASWAHSRSLAKARRITACPSTRLPGALNPLSGTGINKEST